MFVFVLYAFCVCMERIWNACSASVAAVRNAVAPAPAYSVCQHKRFSHATHATHRLERRTPNAKQLMTSHRMTMMMLMLMMMVTTTLGCRELVSNSISLSFHHSVQLSTDTMSIDQPHSLSNYLSSLSSCSLAIPSPRHNVEQPHVPNHTIGHTHGEQAKPDPEVSGRTLELFRILSFNPQHISDQSIPAECASDWFPN